jgi:Domain of unknown function (DUF4760)
MSINTLQDWLPVISLIFTGSALVFAIFSLRANHEWNRRNLACQLVAGWNDKTSAHRRAIELIRPRLVDIDKKSQEIVEITKTDANLIYTSKTGTPDWELRFHFIELLNYFEVIALAYRSRVADQKIIEEALKNVLTRWYDLLINYMQVAKEHRGYEPWEPFANVVQYWKSPRYQPRPPTG